MTDKVIVFISCSKDDCLQEPVFLFTVTPLRYVVSKLQFNSTTNPYMSVVVCVYNPEQLTDLSECVNGVLSQDYSPVEIIIVTEGSDTTNAVQSEFRETERVSIHEISNSDGGLSVARNKGAELSSGDVVVFIDDDAVPQHGWLSRLAKPYQSEDVIAVGGRAEPLWKSHRPRLLPDEFFWLVGSTHANHPESGQIVRNTFGCNISYSLPVFEKMGGFSTSLGKTRTMNLQGEESDMGRRILDEYDKGMYYAGESVVSHKVSVEQSTYRWLANRAFWQGYSKSVLQREHSRTALTNEYGFLQQLFSSSLPKYLGRLLRGQISSLGYLIGVFLFTFLVGLGFSFGTVHSRL